MKNAFIYTLPLFLILSCMDSEEESSMQQIEGRWVNEMVDDIETMEQVLVFQSNGSYESFFIRKEHSEGFAPGILEYYIGNYAIADDKLIFSNRRYFYPEEFENPPSEPGKLIEMDSFSLPNQRAALSFEENRTVMVLVFECNDFVEGFSSNRCLEPEPIFFHRVQE